MFKKLLILTVIILVSCNASEESPEQRKLSEEFKDYWFNGEAEITSYTLNQARYGELREGTAVKIYVTEDFLPGKQVKADQNSPDNISILKLNSTKEFNTGIYPYNIMESSFFPITYISHALKISTSIQEWCGQVYMQLNNKDNFEIVSHSYFADEADQNFNIAKANLENEIWTQLRIEPQKLPTGEIKMIPSFEYLRLSHTPVKSFEATAEYFTEEDLNIYQIHYPDLERTLKIYFTRKFPYHIEKWEETYPTGSGKNRKTMTTTAIKLERIKSAYWNQNSNKHIYLRDTLELN